MSFPSPDSQIQQVLRRVLILNVAVACAKLAVGIATGAVSIIADGIHSLVDGLSNVVAIVAQWLAAQPPDSEHPYGHRRYESIATFIIGGLLMLAAWEIANAAIASLRAGNRPEVTALSFGVMLATLVINIGVVLYEGGRGRALNSRILIADSQHTLTDVLVSSSVIISLILSHLGAGWADGAVALLVVLAIVRLGWHIIRDSVSVLVDAAPLQAEQLSAVVAGIPQAGQVLQARSRGAGEDVRVDLNIQVARELTADHVQSIRQSIQGAIQAQYPQVTEVQVSFTPQAFKSSDYALRARAAADGLGLGVHEVIAIPSEGGMALEMHVEVGRGLSLESAHQQVTALEQALLEEEDITEVTTHIEPLSGHGAPMTHTQAALTLRDHALTIAQARYPQGDWHEATIRLALGGYALTMHCHLPKSMSVEEAHHIAEEVETHIRADLPTIQRVTIHTEPAL